MEEYTLINKDRKRIKVFNLFKDVINSFLFIDVMEISYKCVYKRVNKSVMKGSRVESFENERKEYKKLLGEVWKKNFIFKVT